MKVQGLGFSSGFRGVRFEVYRFIGFIGFRVKGMGLKASERSPWTGPGIEEHDHL